MNVRGLSSCLLMLAPFLCGCMPPITVRTAPVVESLDGTKAASLSLPERGRTTRNELDHNFHQFHVDLGIPTLYWAHMYKSDRRVWMGFPDELLPEQVTLMSQQGVLPSINFAVPVEIEAERYSMVSDEARLYGDQLRVTMVIAQRDLTLSATVAGRWIPPRATHPVTAVIPRQQVFDLWTDHARYGLAERTVNAYLRFKPKTELGSYIAFKVTFSDALTLARWMAQTAPGKPGARNPPAAEINSQLGSCNAETRAY